ncbi:hypothetical protein O0I10_012623 [Lichtheimia ornata]|uniref:SH3 domain-containing protein n=1 Tax=Lichtheimia ornata TaxID=688661 RepID=A0AAD7XVM1_9FUNG|nr:uncharacterized protein O0I10_012623 [Lichtheimia ornata]KAJ8651802.1 hypothetical protein O0I10_012623 [Lichtheimia ornata]
MNSLAANHVLLLTCILTAVGWIVAFVGLCIANVSVNPISWWIVVYELALVIFVCSVLGTGKMTTYRLVVIALVAISVPYATDEVSRYIATPHPALSVASAGYIVILVSQFSWLFLLGVQNNESFEPFQPHHHHQPAYSYRTHPSTPTMTYTTDMDVTKSTAAAAAASPYPMIYNQDNTVFVSPHAEYNIPVVALHSYEANPDDPNELSFTKGEVLHVHERKGNWWQARQADGTVGMIPSNYVTPTTQPI